MATADFSAQQLRELLHYNADTGVFTRLVQTGSRATVGDIAGHKNNLGYVQISVIGRPYKAHRLAWLYVYGAWPKGQIDHRDGCRENNAISNLRDVSHSVNQQNQRHARSDNTNGLIGVSRNHKRWKATIKVGGKNRHIGTFDTPELAHAAYVAAKRAAHLGCTL